MWRAAEKRKRRTARGGKNGSKDLLESLWDEEDKRRDSSRSEIGQMRTKHDVPGADKDDIKDISTPDLKGPEQEKKREKDLSVFMNEVRLEPIIRKPARGETERGLLLSVVRAEERDWLAEYMAIETQRYTHLSMETNLEGSMDPRLEMASESRREDLRLGGKCCIVNVNV